MMDPAFRYDLKAQINTQVANPFRNYLTPELFPGQLRNASTVSLGSLLRPYPQYTSLIQRNTDGRKLQTHTMEIRAQRPFTKGASFLVAYAYNNEKRQEWFDDIAQYEILQSGGDSGWEWRPTNSPRHRVTAAITWQVPVGRDRAFLSNMPALLDAVVGGWQASGATKWYSGRLLLFTNSYIVDGDPTIENPTRDRWFDTTKFIATQDSFTPRSNPWFYDELVGPSAMVTDMTLTKMFSLTTRYKLEARLEAYNLFNQITWDDPDLNIASANFGKVTRKRVESLGREIQIGLRFVF